MATKRSKLYVIKTAPGREKNVIGLIEKYYICEEGQEPGDIIYDVEIEDVPAKKAKRGKLRKVRIPKDERLAMKKIEEEKLAEKRGVPVEEVTVSLKDIPMYTDKVKGASALGFFGLELKGKERKIERKVCLVNEALMPQLKGYVVIDSSRKRDAREVVKRIRHAWKLLDGTVPRKELEYNIRQLEEASRLEIGDFVIPQSGGFDGVKSEVEGFTPDGRVKLKTVNEVIQIRFTLNKDKLVKSSGSD